MASNTVTGPASPAVSQAFSTNQKLALSRMRERGMACVFADGDYVWPVDIRSDEGKAAAVLGVLGDDAQDLATIRHEMTEATAPLAISVLEPPLVDPELAPRSQLDFVGWVFENYNTIFGRTVYPTGAKPIRAPSIPGLNVYACEAYGGQYYAAWSAYDGRLIGWMWYGPKLSQMDHQFAISRVNDEPIFGDMHDYTIRRAPVKAFVNALRLQVQFMKVV